MLVTRHIHGFTVLMLLAMLLAWGGMNYQVLRHKPLVANDTIFEIHKGQGLDQVITQLQQQGIAVNRFWFRLLAYRKQLDRRLKAGEYVIAKGFTSADILNLFAQGKTRQYSITFPEGWSFKQMYQAIQSNPHLQHTLQDVQFKDIMAHIGSEYTHPEGLFFPDTYRFEKNTTDLELLRLAHHKMEKVLTHEWQQRDPAIPLQSPYQALILASIVEKETAAEEERKRIAGVFTRRLQQGMLLQTDPTVIYGMGDDYHGDIRRQDLREPTPYNTYVIEGLPPTPIAMPGREAIYAALHPEDGDALYFVSRGNGRHAFSATLAEHEKYVDRYQR